MKTILLHIHPDDGSEARLRAAVALARLHEGQLVCLQITPRTTYISGDILGNIYMVPDILAAVEASEAKLRAETHARLEGEGIAWSYEQVDGDPALTIVDRAKLIDLVVLSPAITEPKLHEALPLAGDVAIHVRAPVLTVPRTGSVFHGQGPAMVAWNGRAEAANALKAAMPMLRHATSVDIVTVDEVEPDLPAAAAQAYLERHGVEANVLHRPRIDAAVEDKLLEEVDRLGAAYVVMGAYGHSRARETLLGGVTRELLRHSPVPLLLAH